MHTPELPNTLEPTTLLTLHKTVLARRMADITGSPGWLRTATEQQEALTSTLRRIKTIRERRALAATLLAAALNDQPATAAPHPECAAGRHAFTRWHEHGPLYGYAGFSWWPCGRDCGYLSLQRPQTPAEQRRARAAAAMRAAEKRGQPLPLVPGDRVFVFFPEDDDYGSHAHVLQVRHFGDDPDRPVRSVLVRYHSGFETDAEPRHVTPDPCDVCPADHLCYMCRHAPDAGRRADAPVV
ncbi:hypothetical protein ACQPZ8_01215 [Actinomadura nitritigenes]|uniref:hypothetical protein n=1 Tax=Actinomadura nitritigenes TaxID=134602 RepID=UPI003D90D7E1